MFQKVKMTARKAVDNTIYYGEPTHLNGSSLGSQLSNGQDNSESQTAIDANGDSNGGAMDASLEAVKSSLSQRLMQNGDSNGGAMDASLEAVKSSLSQYGCYGLPLHNTIYYGEPTHLNGSSLGSQLSNGQDDSESQTAIDANGDSNSTTPYTMASPPT